MKRISSSAGPLVLACLIALAPTPPSSSARESHLPSLVPVPAEIAFGDGELSLAEGLLLERLEPEWEPVVVRQLESLHGLSWTREREAAEVRARLSIERDRTVAEEGYELHIDGDGIEILSSGPAGVFYAFQTLRQLLPIAVETAQAGPVDDWTLSLLEIRDRPRFSYRGMHLDVGRHFFDVEVVKRYIDTIARFKFNRFHWHLTEDQGWRIEIDAYPALTEIGAWRAESPVDKNLDPYVGDGTPHGGFYTKEQVREVVRYAAERFVTVIPEIEMPGHATAAIAAYPGLGCTDETLNVSTTWGIHDTILCPQEETFHFLETVLGEVIELFPSRYIHIGGDEVPKRQWRESPVAQEVMRREGLDNEDELQSWFIRRIESFLRDHDRRLIGWDEILEGGLAPDATVMSWRGNQGGIEAARQGHDVIMTPVEHAYFDFYQGDPESEPLAMDWAGFPLPLEQVYTFEPVPEELGEDERHHVLGGQGNLWTEYIPTAGQLEYMAYPRAMAMAEVVWSPASARDWGSFRTRLEGVLPRLDTLGVRYRPLDE